MRSMSKAGRIRSAVAALAVAGLAAGTAAVMSGGGTAGAVPVHLSLNYSCVFPLIGAQPMTVNIDSDMPASVPVGTATGAFNIDSVTVVNDAARTGLRTVGATTLEGTVAAKANLSAPNLNLPLTVGLTIPTQPIPATAGSFNVNASGSTPSLTFQANNVGTATITVGDLLLTMTPKDANGQPTGLGTFESPCTVVAGQNQVLHSLTITGPGSTTSTTTGSSTSTTQATTSTTQATTSTTRPATTTTTAPAPLDFKFNIAGNSFIGSANGNVPIKGKITAHFNLSTGTYTAELVLDPTVGTFSILGFLPTTANISFQQTAPTTGTLIDGKLTSKSTMNTILNSVNLFGLPIGGGPDCKTTTPSVIDLATPAGQTFNPLAGGKLTGTYALAGLNDQCGFLGGFISIFMAGANNTLELNLTTAP